MWLKMNILYHFKLVALALELKFNHNATSKPIFVLVSFDP
jgi:hypothetical protein